jgi:succinate dehydrogenase / fumarate reductase iron-sulfur subunit
MNVILHIWRQAGPATPGRFETYPVADLSPDMSFLEMLDVLNETLVARGDEPIAFDSDCREGICGACSLVIDGIPHGPVPETTTCQLYLRHFPDGAEITVEPFRARAFPVIRDLVVDRGALDRVLQTGGYASVNTGSAPDANTHLVAKEDAETALDAAACLGCGACVAACPNASAMLFVAAKVTHFSLLPQGQPERIHRAITLVEAMDREGFGACSNHYECGAVCPEGIPVRFIARLNRDYLRAALTSREFTEAPGTGTHVE